MQFIRFILRLIVMAFLLPFWPVILSIFITVAVMLTLVSALPALIEWTTFNPERDDAEYHYEFATLIVDIWEDVISLVVFPYVYVVRGHM